VNEVLNNTVYAELALEIASRFGTRSSPDLSMLAEQLVAAAALAAWS
jgi:hypothetical protein